MSDLRKVFTTLGASNYVSEDRERDDYYATLPQAIDALLKNFEIPPTTKIWECACGEGHLSKRLVERGFEVYSSDLVNRGYGEIKNFFDCTEKLDAHTLILTNPPYKYAMEFVLHALELLPENAFCLMFLKLLFLEGQKRFAELFRTHPPKTVFVFSKRMKCAKNGEFNRMQDRNSAIAYCWYVWQKGFRGTPAIQWI
jgi:hypothetical protein